MSTGKNKHKGLFAQAQFTNNSEYPEELAFKRGDILKVVSQKPEIEGVSGGWWLCVDRNGKRGVAPANRLKMMDGHDDYTGKNFFEVANNLFNDFSMFGNRDESPFSDDFFRGPRMFPPTFRDRFDSLRRVNSCENPLSNSHNSTIVRNIPIKIISQNEPRVASSIETRIFEEPPQRRFSDASNVGELRRTVSNGGRVSPTHLSRNPLASSDDDELGSSSTVTDGPQRTLVIPSSIPGRTIEIPIGTSSLNNLPSQRRKENNQMDKITQKLKNLAKPFRIPSTSDSLEVEPRLRRDEDLRTPSPSSSGICADLTDPSSSEEKRSSDISSVSDQNGSLTEERPSLISQHEWNRNPMQTRLSDEYSLPRKDWVVPNTVEEDMRKNLEQPWNTIPTRVVRNIGDILEEELGSRKRIVCNKLADCLKNVEHYSSLIAKSTAAQNWRAPYILQGSLPTIREACYSFMDAVGQFLETTGRVSIDRTNIKYVELNRLLAPLSEHRSIMSSLRDTLDHSGWTVAVLARDRTDRSAGDALDQFISLSRQIQPDCVRILQWTIALVPSNSILFLSPTSTSTSRLPSQSTQTSSPIPPQQRQFERNIPLLNMSDEKRNSTSSNSTIGGGTATSSESSPSSILVTSNGRQNKPSRGRVTFVDEPSDRSSSGSSIDNSSLEYATINKVPNLDESRIMEEDDLESIVSDRDLFQDYAYLDDVVPGRSKLGNVNEEDQNLIQFYQPQFDEQTDALTTSVEDFLAAVENNQPPREFVQKGKLIILAAHKLIYIGDTVSECLSDKDWGYRLKTCADDVCTQLKDCVQAMKTAADEFPDIKTMQLMLDSVMKVSMTSMQLKAAFRQ